MQQAEVESPKREAWKRHLFTVTVINLVFLGFVIFFRLCFHEKNWLSAFLYYIPQVLFLIIPVVLVIASIIMKQWQEAAINVLTMIFVLLELMGFYIHLPFSGINKSDHRLKVITYNIEAGKGGPEEIGGYLGETDADIIFLQEAWAAPGKKGTDPLPVILKRLKGYHHARGGDGGELAIISKLPLTRVHEKRLGKYRSCLVTQIFWGNKNIKLANVHFDVSFYPRSVTATVNNLVNTSRFGEEQADLLVKLFAIERNPIIIAGDFNMIPKSRGHNLMKSSYQDCFEKGGGGFGYTWPSRLPLWRIDYVFVDPNLSVGDCRLDSPGLSDHKPVLAEVSTD